MIHTIFDFIKIHVEIYEKFPWASRITSSAKLASIRLFVILEISKLKIPELQNCNFGLPYLPAMAPSLVRGDHC